MEACAVANSTLGEVLDPDRLDQLARYRAHLDRKLGHVLAMLLRLKDMRRTITPDAT